MLRRIAEGFSSETQFVRLILWRKSLAGESSKNRRPSESRFNFYTKKSSNELLLKNQRRHRKTIGFGKVTSGKPDESAIKLKKLKTL